MVECFSHVSDIEAKNEYENPILTLGFKEEKKKGKTPPFLAVFLGLPPWKAGVGVRPIHLLNGVPKRTYRGTFSALMWSFLQNRLPLSTLFRVTLTTSEFQ